MIKRDFKNTKEKICDAAKIIFIEKGFKGATSRDIAKNAGVNLALLNYYFGGKQGLFDAVMLDTINDFAENMEKVINDENSTLEDKINSFCDKYFDFIVSDPNLVVFIRHSLSSGLKNIEKIIKFEEK